MYPFGEESALVVDGVHQYTAFYKELASQLGKGLGWTYSSHAMGYNFYGLFCYYLCSPFSLLVLLLMKFMYVNEAVIAVILVKVGLCSVSMAWYSGKNILAEAAWQFLLAACTACLILCWAITAM